MADTARKYFPKSEEAKKGHMHTLPQGMQSTKIRIDPEEEEEECKTRPSRKHKDVFGHVYDFNNRMQEKSTSIRQDGS